MHRHEYSAPLDTRSNYIPRRTPLTRSPFSTPIPRRSTTYDNPIPIIHRALRPLSEHIPRNNEHTVRFQEPEADTMSEDGRSVANSEGSETTAGGGRRRRRTTRTSTAFHLAHPAPTLTQKQRLLHIRPKLLLQLQRLSADSRPKPALDVLPSTVVVPRLAKKFTRMFRGKGELGANDVMVVRSEEYDAPDEHAVEETDSDEEGLANRELMAVICQMPKDSGDSQGKAEIVLSDGSVWVGTPLPNGLYEFATVDERGDKTTARWVRRSSRSMSSELSGDTVSNGSDCKFTFSIIDPSSRRHPIMASITQNTLDIPDNYTSVSSSARKYPPTLPIRAFPGEIEHPSLEEEAPAERTTHAIDERMKILIQVTGIWVALRQGWSPSFKYNDAMCAAPTNPRITSGGRVRSASLTPDVGRPSPVPTGSSTPESSHSAFGAVGSKIRRTCVKGSPATGASPQFERATPPPKRTISTGTAFMQRAAARRNGNPPSTVACDSEGEVIFQPLRRAVTEIVHDSLTPHLPGSSATTPDTPTKPQRPARSAYIPTSALQNGYTNGQTERHSMEILDGKQSPNSGEKPKMGRWKAFTNLFRRLNSSARTE
jgi:hypothetical protein